MKKFVFQFAVMFMKATRLPSSAPSTQGSL